MSETRITEAQQPIEHAGTVGQAEIDARNLELYAAFFCEHQRELREMSWTVPERTLREIANRVRNEPKYHTQFKLAVAAGEVLIAQRDAQQERAEAAESKLTALSAILNRLKEVQTKVSGSISSGYKELVAADKRLEEALRNALPELLRVMEGTK